MSFKENLKSSYQDKELINKLQYSGARTVFVIMCLAFAMSLFSMGAGFYTEVVSYLVIPSYFGVLISFNFFLFFVLKKHHIDKPGILYGVLGLSIAISLLLSLIGIVDIEIIQGFIG